MASLVPDMVALLQPTRSHHHLIEANSAQEAEILTGTKAKAQWQEWSKGLPNTDCLGLLIPCPLAEMHREPIPQPVLGINHGFTVNVTLLSPCLTSKASSFRVSRTSPPPSLSRPGLDLLKPQA